MNRTLILAALATSFSASALAGNFGSAAVAPKPAAAAAPVLLSSAGPVAAPLAAGPQAGEAFRIVKPDGATVIAQGVMGSNVLTGTPINVSDKDAFIISGGKCAFNVKYDEVSSTAAAGTINRLYSNDRLIAQNTKIDLAPNLPRTIWTQPYLTAGVNNVRIVVNADGAAPSTKWIRVNVSGTCGAAPTTVTPPVTPPATAKPAPPVVRPAPVTPPPVVHIVPGSAQWNNLNNMWGYSNYAVAQLKNAKYARYADLVKLNAAVTAVIKAKTVEQGGYNSLIASWNSFVTEPQFKALMAAVVPGTDKK